MLYSSDKDFFVSCQHTRFPVHKFILISNSEYFCGFFKCLKADQNECCVDIPAEYMENIIKYMYFGLEGIRSLSNESQSLLIPFLDFLIVGNTQLHDSIGSMITDVLDNENVFELLLSAHRMKAISMKHMILEYFINNYRQLVESEQMNVLPIEVLIELHRWRAALCEN